MTGHVITIAQQKGGAGKTTLTAHLAVAASEAGRSVAVIDSDPQGSLGRWFMTRVEAHDGDSGGLNFSTASAWGIAYECDKLKSEHDLVFVDTPPKVDADLRPAFRASDLVVVPVSASQMDLWATDSVLDMAAREDVPTLAVLNRIRKGTRLTEQMMSDVEHLECQVSDVAIANRVIYAETLGKGRTGSEIQRKGPAATEMRALLDDILVRLD